MDREKVKELFDKYYAKRSKSKGRKHRRDHSS